MESIDWISQDRLWLVVLEVRRLVVVVLLVVIVLVLVMFMFVFRFMFVFVFVLRLVFVMMMVVMVVSVVVVMSLLMTLVDYDRVVLLLVVRLQQQLWPTMSVPVVVDDNLVMLFLARLGGVEHRQQQHRQHSDGQAHRAQELA